MALIDLKGHYLDLLVQALEAHGLSCLHLGPEVGNYQTTGVIITTINAQSTASVMAVKYAFYVDAFHLEVHFRDGRPVFEFKASFIGGIDDLWVSLARAIAGNRLENKAAATPGSEVHELSVTQRERDTILAALRFWQRDGGNVADVVDIATNGGQHKALNGVEIDLLCERINS